MEEAGVSPTDAADECRPSGEAMSRTAASSTDSECQAVAYYEDRYAHGYMDEWPLEKKRRLFELIRGLDLPATGEAIDYGCGNGVLTEVIRQALPAWDVWGVDISPTAVLNATSRFPACRFYLPNAPELRDRQFDLLFTHHVLEHVNDLPREIARANQMLKPSASMLHILPCGNAGSLEHTVCLLRRDGIAADQEGRFFFEDPGHLRRLTSAQLTDLCARHGFVLQRAFYANQYYGAIRWLTRSLRFTLQFAAPTAAVDGVAERKLRTLRRRLATIACWRAPAFHFERALQQRRRALKHYLLLAATLPLYPIAKPLEVFLRRKAEEEWLERQRDPAGSEMYLFCCRDAESGSATISSN